jgi:hypothetical protein
MMAAQPWQAFPQPVLLHRRGQRAGGRGRCRQHHQRRLVGTYLQWCYDNLALNGQGGNQHLLVQADAMAGWKATVASTT